MEPRRRPGPPYPFPHEGVDYFIGRNPDSPAARSSRRKILARIVARDMVGDRLVPRIRHDAHPDLISVFQTGALVFVQMVRLDELKTEAPLVPGGRAGDLPDQNLTVPRNGFY